MRTQYRDAADKRKQVGILAELYDCPKEEVLDALGLAEKAPLPGPIPNTELPGSTTRAKAMNRP